MKKSPVLSLMLLAFCFSATAQNLIVNGGFDTNSSGWTTTASSGWYEPNKGNPGGCFVLFSASTPTISQVVTGLIPGSNYVISGDYNIEGGTITNTPSFGVAIDGIFLLEVATTNYGWHSFSFPYTATSSGVTLSLTAQINGTSTSYDVDNIVVQPIPSLGIQISGANTILSWPTNSLGFSLQSAASLDSGSWNVITNTPIAVGTNLTVTLSATNQVQFFNLKR
jgi:hypothetical protein